MSAPPVNIEAINAGTRVAMQAGHRLLQTHRFQPNDTEQVRMLLGIMAPPPNSIILDAGCGIGEVARIMADIRPDLLFVLANLSDYQLAQCPLGHRFMRLQQDCHRMTLPDESVGAAMYSSALCQMDTLPALQEAHRVLRRDGILLINDMIRDGGNPDWMEKAVGARVLPKADLLAAVRAAGFSDIQAVEPTFDDSSFRAMLEVDGHHGMIDQVRPIIIRATKGSLL